MRASFDRTLATVEEVAVAGARRRSRSPRPKRSCGGGSPQHQAAIASPLSRPGSTSTFWLGVPRRDTAAATTFVGTSGPGAADRPNWWATNARSFTPPPLMLPPPSSSETSSEVQPSSAPWRQNAGVNPAGSWRSARRSEGVALSSRNFAVVSAKNSWSAVRSSSMLPRVTSNADTSARSPSSASVYEMTSTSICRRFGVHATGTERRPRRRARERGRRGMVRQGLRRPRSRRVEGRAARRRRTPRRRGDVRAPSTRTSGVSSSSPHRPRRPTLAGLLDGVDLVIEAPGLGALADWDLARDELIAQHPGVDRARDHRLRRSPARTPATPGAISWRRRSAAPCVMDQRGPLKLPMSLGETRRGPHRRARRAGRGPAQPGDGRRGRSSTAPPSRRSPLHPDAYLTSSRVGVPRPRPRCR